MPISLVVDDEPSVRRYVSIVLQRENFRTVEAESGSQALRIVQDLAGDVDLIVSDIQMPNGDGLSLAHAVKMSFPAVPVILVSGNATLGAGFDFVEKPFLASVLLNAVRNVLARKTKTPRPD
ncbi:MAG TPA: response regulator [Bryobacteraceae bacterium]|nr:response regulator [Bryobacteraceae bacterium]